MRRSVFDPRKPHSCIAEASGYYTVDVAPQLAGRLFSEAWEDEVHKGTQDFWNKLPEGHPFHKHPTFSIYGDKLARSAHGFTADRMQSSGADMRGMMQILHQILQIEKQHKEELEELAKEVTIQLWGIDKDQLSAELTSKVDINEQGEDEQTEDDPDDDGPDAGTWKQIAKRITMNTLTHGSAIHQMMSAHHLVNQELEAIDPRLIQLYNKLTAGSTHQYWLLDIPQVIQQLAQMAVGSTRVEYPEDVEVDFGGEEEQGEEEERMVETGSPMVIAKAICFPVLVQELSKGVAELISHHGLDGMDGPLVDRILSHADRLVDEPWLIQVGPELWRHFLKAIPRGRGAPSVAEILAALANLQPDEMHKIIDATIDDPENAKSMLRDLVQEEEPQDYQDEGEKEESWDTGSRYEDEDSGGEDESAEDWEKEY